MPSAAALLLVAGTLAGASRQGVDDPAIRAAVERFFAVQEAEDVAGYVALWSSTVPVMRLQQLPGQLKFIFDSGDDKFSDITITRVVQDGDELRVRVNATRDRTTTRTQPDGTPVVVHSKLQTSLTFVREGGALKLLREGSAADDLAGAYLKAQTAADREALLAAEPELVNEYFVTAVSRQADFAVQGQQYGRALEIYNRALEVARLVRSRRMEGDVLQNIANTRYFLRDYPGALQSYEERLVIARELANDEAMASAHFGIGTTKYLTFDYNAALASYEQALAIQLRLQDDPAAAVSYVSTGNVRYLQADYEAAADDYRRSRDLQRKLNNREGEARALEGLGRVSAAQGDYAAALEAYASVLDEARGRGSRASQGTTLESLGDVQFRLGNFETARSLFDESRTHFEAIGDLANVGRVWQEIALTDLISHRFAAAEQEYGKSRTACESGRSDRECMARAIVGLAFAQASQEHFADAIPTYRKAIDAFSALNRFEEAARAEVGLAQALYGNKDAAAALATAAHAEQQATSLAADDIVWRARVAAARTHRRMKSPDKAMAAAEAAVAAVRKIAAASLEHPSDRIASDTTTPYAILAVLRAEGGDAAGAFAAIEERRTHALRIELLANERDIARGMTPAERDEERKAAAALVAVQKQMVAERALPRPDAARIWRLQQTAVTALAERNGQQQRLFERLPDLRAWRGLLTPATADDAVRALPPDDGILVEFLIDDEDVLAVIAGRVDGGVEFRAYATSVARNALAERIAKTLEFTALRNVDVWRKASVELLGLLPSGAFERLAGASRAVVIPDDVLWRVPFEALPVKAGVLADRTVVAYASSVTALVKAPPPAVGDAPASTLAVGAPELSAAVRDRVKSTSPGWVVRPTDSATAELQALAPPAEASGLTTLSGPAATEAAVRAAASNVSVVHVAAPFRINSASPLFSPVLLAAGQAPSTSSGQIPSTASGPATATAPLSGQVDPAADGVLETREIVNLDLRAKVAVLSDGEAASMRDAAAQIGTIQWAWRAAGVPSIVLPKWPGNEPSSSALLAEFHKALRGGDGPEIALEKARTAIRKTEATSAPYFWAGWMLVGR